MRKWKFCKQITIYLRPSQPSHLVSWDDKTDLSKSLFTRKNGHFLTKVRRWSSLFQQRRLLHGATAVARVSLPRGPRWWSLSEAIPPSPSYIQCSTRGAVTRGRSSDIDGSSIRQAHEQARWLSICIYSIKSYNSSSSLNLPANPPPLQVGVSSRTRRTPWPWVSIRRARISW